MGERTEARILAAATVESSTEEIAAGSGLYMPFHRLAVSYLLLGETAAALDALERSVVGGYRDVAEMKHVPVLEPLHEHPRFRTLLARLETLAVEARVQAESAADHPLG